MATSHDAGADGSLAELRRGIIAAHRAPETDLVPRLAAAIPLDAAAGRAIAVTAKALAQHVRDRRGAGLSAEDFLAHFGLGTREGIALMCLAEALLRIPDEQTVDRLLADKLAGTEWSAREEDEGFLMNAATWGLMLTGRLYDWRAEASSGFGATLAAAVKRLGEPVARTAVRQAMRIMAEQFIVAEHIEEALDRAPERERRGYRFSYDMLGEAARTAADARRYEQAYRAAIDMVSARAAPGAAHARSGISIKLSALHPRYEAVQRGRVLDELLPRLHELALAARAGGIPLTIDAEEADRLMLSLDLIERLARDPALAGWNGLGLAVQAYSKRAFALCAWLIVLARASARRIPVRLVKGAYWDTEVKHAQVLGLTDYPVFTRKTATDVSYLACAHRLLGAPDAIAPAFATHNCHTVAAVEHLAREVHHARDYEFQKLQGMGDALYDALYERSADAATRAPCRIYAPVGSHRDLLAYLVRRLLENGANSSFVHQIADEHVPLEILVASPIDRLPRPYTPNPKVPPPHSLYPDRRNSLGLDLCDATTLDALRSRIAEDRGGTISAPKPGAMIVREPGSLDRIVGAVQPSGREALEAAIARARTAQGGWARTPAAIRATALERAADRLEADRLGLVSLLVREAGKTYPDAVAEVREAADFLRYYAVQARQLFAAPVELNGPTGERNTLALHGRGVFACISPWNFPLAIFTGQVAAALAAGNAVIAKPAEQTPLVAMRAVTLMREAGVPRDVLELAFGTGEAVGASLVADARIAGVAFTGSVETAQAINRTLAARPGPIAALIAETGGLNAMIVDSSALPEQVVADTIASAFQSAGQRCSALRILALQAPVADRILEMLGGAMRELRVGDPGAPDTDVGPVIDADALAALAAHRERLERTGRRAGETALPADLPRGHYFAPVAYELDAADLPDREVFGPILHVVRYERAALARLLERIAAPGYGLTLGIASRIDGFIDEVTGVLHAGNTYVNRNMIGAVVGVQPFGGEGLSGTGPKAGGPHYLPRFALERTVTINTTAVGGNAALMDEES